MTTPLQARRIGIDTYHEPTVYLHRECSIARAEGFSVQSRVLVKGGRGERIARLNMVTGPLLNACEAGLSDSLWAALELAEGETVTVAHPPPLTSFGHVRAKIYGKELPDTAISEIIRDVAAQRYSGVELAAFLTACAGDRLNVDEIAALTRAMVESGQQLHWGSDVVLDKHCVGGLPGNRTTPIVVAIIAANGLIIPKTSSRAITSPAGTADMMEVLAPVDLDLAAMRRVVEREYGCLVWGGRAALSPADDILIHIERLLDLDSEGQLVASVLSKKLAAGSRQLLIDMPVGPTAKVRDMARAQLLADLFTGIGGRLGLRVAVHTSHEDGPVGNGIGPALEARDVVAVLKGDAAVPADLRARALALAARLLELAPGFDAARAAQVAQDTLDGGRAWHKFQAICEAQGGMRAIPHARFTYPVTAQQAGRIAAIDNRNLARAAKFSGAPHDKAAGIDMHVRVGTVVAKGQPLFTLHAETRGELDYALQFISATPLFRIEPA